MTPVIELKIVSGKCGKSLEILQSESRAACREGGSGNCGNSFCGEPVERARLRITASNKLILTKR